MNYDKELLDSIERERIGSDYFCQLDDKKILTTMIDKINENCGTSIRYLAEIDAFNIPGSGTIMVQYLNQFQSESIRSYLIPQIVSDRVKDCAKIVLLSYLHFKDSDEYISAPGEPAPAHIYVRYDNAFRTLKPKKLKYELVSLAYNPRDAFYLPFTMRMLASWRIPDLDGVFASYMGDDKVTHESVGLPEQAENSFPSLSFMKRELKFTAIDCMKYYPSVRNLQLIICHLDDPDKDIGFAARRALRFIEKHFGNIEINPR